MAAAAAPAALPVAADKGKDFLAGTDEYVKKVRRCKSTVDNKSAPGGDVIVPRGVVLVGVDTKSIGVTWKADGAIDSQRTAATFMSFETLKKVMWMIESRWVDLLKTAYVDVYNPKTEVVWMFVETENIGTHQLIFRRTSIPPLDPTMIIDLPNARPGVIAYGAVPPPSRSKAQ
jgi:hypothetical protein